MTQTSIWNMPESSALLNNRWGCNETELRKPIIVDSARIESINVHKRETEERIKDFDARKAVEDLAEFPTVRVQESSTICYRSPLANQIATMITKKLKDIFNNSNKYFKFTLNQQALKAMESGGVKVRNFVDIVTKEGTMGTMVLDVSIQNQDALPNITVKIENLKTSEQASFQESSLAVLGKILFPKTRSVA